MLQGTCVGASVVKLGITVNPTLEERIDAGLHVGSASDVTYAAWGLIDSTARRVDASKATRNTIQAAAFELDEGRGLKPQALADLYEISGDPVVQLDLKTGVRVSRFRDPFGVLAYTLIEGHYERPMRPSRPCCICGRPIPSKFRNDRLACSDECEHVRKKDADRADKARARAR